MIIAKQSTARIVTVGPVLDADGVAVTDGVVGDFKISKNGGAPAALNGSATLTHRNTGHYSLSLTTSDLDTVGQVEIVIDDTTNACPVKEITVVEEAVYDAFFAASAVGYVANAPVNVAQFGGSNGTFSSGRPEVNTTHIAGSSVSTSSAQIGVNVVNAAGTAWNSGAIGASTLASDTIAAAKIATGAITSAKFAAGAIDAAAIANGAIDAATFAADVDAEILSYLVDDATRIDASALNTATGTSIPAILTDTGTTLDGKIDAIDTVVDAIKAVTDALPDSGALTSLATAAALTTVDGVVDAIKATTDKLDDTLEDQGGGTYGFTEAALAEAPAGSGATAQDVWEYATRTLTAIDEDSTTLDIDAAVRAAVGLASANLDTQLTTIDGNVDDILVDTSTTLQAELDGIQADTEDIQSRLPAALTGDGNMKVDVLRVGGNSSVPTNMIVVFSTDFATNYDTSNDKWSVLSDLRAIGGSGVTSQAGQNFDTFFDNNDTPSVSTVGKLAGLALANGTIGATGNSTTALHLTGLTYGNDEINNCLLVIQDVSAGEYHARWVEDWADTGDLATVATLPFTPEDEVDRYWLLPIRQDVTGGSGLDAAGVRAAIGMASANLDTQLAALPTAAENADAVWEEALADHEGTAGSTAEALADAGGSGASAADIADAVLDEALSGHTTAGTLGKAIADILDDTGTSGVIVASIANNAITAAAAASDFGTEVATAVWASGTRLLTAGTNIVLAKGTGVTGFNDLSAAQVNAEVDTALSDVGLTTTITGRIDAAISTRQATIWSSASATVNLSGTTIATVSGNVGGNVSGSVGSVTGGINTGSGTITTLDALDTAQDSQHSTTQTAIADLPTNSELTTALGTLNDLSAAEVNAEVLDVINVDTLIDGKTIKEALQYIAASTAGRVSGAGTGTEVFKGLDESTTRLTVTTDDDGNRTDVTYG